MFNNFEKPFDSSLTGLGNSPTYLDKDPFSPNPTPLGLGQLPPLNTTPDNAGNTLARARAVGTLTATQSFSDWVGSGDTNDYYSFNVGTQSNFSLSLTGLSANADVRLLNNFGSIITTSATTGTTSESITSQLSAGTYYVQVYQSSGNTNYSLSLTALPADNAGNTLATARTVGTLTATQSFSDWVGSGDTNDYYSFNVGTQSNFSLSLTGLSA
ncbi:PPC domain-containing protein, partial [Cuspidothrix issatschenkoi LEGE 03284]|uniref:PPC domain-containing protein n=1 Tax=Cuspidothrix issatschenkoi TaxID=230752 RepID=UPI00187FB7B5